MDDRDFLAQMAQFSALESQQQMTRSMELQQAYTMIGKTVYAHFFCDTADRWMEVDGPVMHVRRRGSEILLGVHTEVPVLDEHGELVRNELGEIVSEFRTVDTPVDRVTFTEDPHLDSLMLRGIMNNVANARDISLIGNYVFARIVEEGNGNRRYIEGRVDAVNFINGRAVLSINGEEVFSEEVLSVSDTRSIIGRNIRIAHFNSSNNLVETEGTIRNIVVTNNRQYVDVDGTRVRLNRLDHLLEALQLEGRYVAHNEADFSGVVDTVSIRGAIVYLYPTVGQRMTLESFRDGGRVLTSPPAPPETPEEDDSEADD
jgi:hypothetical protein